jgi:hypothetical protein
MYWYVVISCIKKEQSLVNALQNIREKNSIFIDEKSAEEFIFIFHLQDQNWYAL